MKKSLVLAAFVALLLASQFASPAVAQRPAPAAVAIIDLTYIFKHHTRFNGLTGDMRRDVETAEAEIGKSRDAAKALVDRLDEYKKGTPEYKNLTDEITKRQADMQARVNIQKTEFLDREAKIYYSVYQEILDEVKYYADANGISLVMRFNGDPVDQNNPQEVLKELNKSVVYYNRSIDITPLVLKKLNDRGQGGGAAVPRSAVAPRAGAK